MAFRILMVPSWQIVPVDRLSPHDTEIVCRQALEHWQSRTYDFLLLCGGRFLPPEVQTRPSSEIMRDWFVSNGVPCAKILLETASLDTFENIRFGVEALERAGLDLRNTEIIICSQALHASRIQVTFLNLFGIRADIRAVEIPLGTSERVWQACCLLYHRLDRTGKGFFARTIRNQRAVAAAGRPMSPTSASSK